MLRAHGPACRGPTDLLRTLTRSPSPVFLLQAKAPVCRCRGAVANSGHTAKCVQHAAADPSFRCRILTSSSATAAQHDLLHDSLDCSVPLGEIPDPPEYLLFHQEGPGI